MFIVEPPMQSITLFVETRQPIEHEAFELAANVDNQTQRHI